MDTLDVFYKDFDKVLTKAEKAMEGKRVKVPDEETDVECDLCGRKMVIKIGRFGKFLACPGFPDVKILKKSFRQQRVHVLYAAVRLFLKSLKKEEIFMAATDIRTVIL